MARRHSRRERLLGDILILTLTMIVAGFLCVAVLKLALPADDRTRTEAQQLVELIQSLEEENAVLAEDIAALLREGEYYSVAESFDGEQTNALAESVDSGKVEAGLTELTGGGIVVTLDDNTADAAAAQQQNPGQYNAQDYIVHDANLLYLVNDLRPLAAGIAINGQRIVTGSTIRCVGTVILINQTRMAPPYRVEVVGDSDKLMQALEKSGAYATLTASKISVKAAAAKKLKLPAYTGTIEQEHITVLPPDAEGSNVATGEETE